ncbi:MAG: Flp pilus assembly complex ATPase component TadA [Acidobacteria bacterium]|nr:Flp pilus assembly complex ATPase component TadA [Acidobacteriota bacterium]
MSHQPVKPDPGNNRAGKNKGLSNVEKFLIAGVENRATSIYMFPGSCITYRVGNKLLKVPDSDLTAPMVMDLAAALLPAEVRKTKSDDEIRDYLQSFKSTDFVYSIPGTARFRVHIFRQRGSLAICIRVIFQEIPDLKQYNLPEDFTQLLKTSRSGIYIVHGKARSGKSSLASAIVDYYNKSVSRVIVILEPVIQFSHRNQYSLITQRELGPDLVSLKEGVMEAMRQDQDIVVVDELSDPATFEKVLEAAYRGMTVWAVTGTPETEKTLQYLLSFRPRELQLDLINDLMTYLRGLLSTSVEVQPDGKRIFRVEYKSAGIINTLLLSRRREMEEKSGKSGFKEDLGGGSSVDQSWFED